MKRQHVLNKAIAVLTSAILLLSAAAVNARTHSYEKALRLEDRGQFREATALLKESLRDDSARLSRKEKQEIEYEIIRMRRIRIDYSLTADKLFTQLQEGIRGITRPEFQRWIKEGKFDSRTIDDTLRFVNASRSNLFFRYPAIAARRIPPVNDDARYLAFLDNCISIERAADSLKTPYVLPRKFRMRMTLSVDSGVVKPGDTVRAWLPIPHQFPYQIDFNLIGSSSNPLAVAPPDSPIRSVYMEQPASQDGGAQFSIEYSYTTYGVHFNLDPRKVEPYIKSGEIYRRFTGQGPNIVFTRYIKDISGKIVGRATNPLVKARRIYKWISRDIKYSFAREYSTIRNIGGYCLVKGYGDCGQEVMLFITLCRYNGIPARWQSGWYFFPGGKDIHDWTEIYLRPYGWVPVDPYMGILAERYMTSLTHSQREIVRNFYFGGLDQYRMSANSDNNQKLTPAKRFFRSDNVDFQRGEVETERHNIYFDRFYYSLTVQESKVAGDR